MEKKITNTQLINELRTHYMDIIRESLEQIGETELLTTASNEITIPCLDSEKNERFITLKFIVPKGSKDEIYDGYSVAESYKMHIDEMEQKKKEAKAKADAKKLRDAERRAKAKEKKSTE